MDTFPFFHSQKHISAQILCCFLFSICFGRELVNLRNFRRFNFLCKFACVELILLRSVFIEALLLGSGQYRDSSSFILEVSLRDHGDSTDVQASMYK
jgi:hypothetical protein